MKRLPMLVIAACVLAGCRNQGTSVTDPFFPYTRVPPPATGAFSGGKVDPYYPGMRYSPPPNSTIPGSPRPQIPSANGASPPVSGSGDRYTPPSGDFRYQGVSVPAADSSRAPRLATRAVPPASPESAAGADGGATNSSVNRIDGSLEDGLSQPAKRQPVVQILRPRPEAGTEEPRRAGVSRSVVAAAPSEPRRLEVPKRAVNIVDLPKADTSKAATGGESAPGAGGFRLVSGDEPTGSRVVAAGGTSAGGEELTSQLRYAHDPGYAWLRGKLEYSQIERLWKLRYIPVDGTTDDFGGSVMLPDPTVLAGYERGDFVEVRGRIGQRDAKKGYAPTYETSEIKRLSP